MASHGINPSSYQPFRSATQMPRSPRKPFALTKHPGPAHLARRPAPRHAANPSATDPRRRAPRSRISATCRSTRSTSSSAATTTSSTRASRPMSGRISPARRAVDKTVFEYWTHALSYVPTRGSSLLPPRDEAPAARTASLVRLGPPRRTCAASSRAPQERRADHPRHRRRRAGGEGPSLGEPKTLEARAAARLLRRHPDDQRAHRHAEDLRADGAAISAGRRRPRRRRQRAGHSNTCSTARLRSQGIVSLDSVCQHDAKPQAGDPRADRVARAPQGARAGRARRRRQDASTGRARNARRAARRRAGRSSTSSRPSTRSSSSASG